MRAELYGGMICVEGSAEEIAVLAKLIAPVPLLNAIEKVCVDAEKKAWEDKDGLG